MGICNLPCVDIGKGEVKAKKCLDICRDFGIMIYAVCQQKVNMQWYRRGHNEHDWKSCCRQKRHEGSNPSHCAILSDQNRYTHLKPLRNQGFQRFYALFFQSVFYRYTRAFTTPLGGVVTATRWPISRRPPLTTICPLRSWSSWCWAAWAACPALNYKVNAKRRVSSPFLGILLVFFRCAILQRVLTL